MATKRFIHFLACCIVASGCSRRPSDPPTPNVEPPPRADQSPASATPNRSQAAEQAPPADASPQPQAADDASAQLIRDLAPRLVEADQRGGWRINDQAAKELEKLGPEGVARLWKLLQDPDDQVRRGAAFYLLGRLNPNDTVQVAAFLELLDDRDRTIRGIAVSAVKELRYEDQVAAVPRLVSRLDPQREDNPATRAAVARFCSSLKGDAVLAAPALHAAATADPDEKVRAAALAAVTHVAAPIEAAPTLAKGLKDQAAPVRLVAAARLRQLSAAAVPFAGELAAALADADSGVAEAAAEALVRVGAPAVEPLVSQLAGTSPSARKLALACLAKLGPAAQAAVPAIEKCRQDPDPLVRQLAEAAVLHITGKRPNP